MKYKVLHFFKRRHCEKLCCERTSQFYICVFIQCSRRRPTDRPHRKFPFSHRNWRSRSHSTDVVVVNFVEAFKFPNRGILSPFFAFSPHCGAWSQATSVLNECLRDFPPIGGFRGRNRRPALCAGRVEKMCLQSCRPVSVLPDHKVTVTE